MFQRLQNKKNKTIHVMKFLFAIQATLKDFKVLNHKTNL